MAVDESERDDLLDRLGEEFAARLRRGEQPSLKDYADRYPELADEIRELFPALVKVEQVKEIYQGWDEAERNVPPLSQVGDYRVIREIGSGGMGVVYEAEQISLGRRVALKVLPWQSTRERTTLERFRREARASARLHHTNIVPVFEVGQDGQVSYYAMQFIQGQSLDAVIDELRRLRGRSAVRDNRRGQADQQHARQTDSATLGKNAHLWLVDTLLSGQFDQRPPVMAEVPAAAVSDVSAPGSSGPEPTSTTASDNSAMMPGGARLSSVESRHRAFHRGVAHIGRQAASALAHAHARGIVHRDVKPSNQLLDTEGVVWVSDFGLAKVDEDELTRTGDVLGTLRYMAPERFRGGGDARADLYSLGLTLYEILVLRPAFDSPDRVALSEQIKSVDPPRPRSVDPRVPRDLETIILKAIEKDPKARYASAEAMAEDLRRFLDDEPILARRVGAAERYLRWARRNPAIAILGAMLTAVLVGATIGSVVVAGRMAAQAVVNEGEKLIAQEAQQQAVAGRREAEHQRELAEQHQKQAEAERREASRQHERAEQHLYTARIGQAVSALRLEDPATARGLLDLCRPEPGELDRRGWEWSYLEQWCRSELRTISLPTAAQSYCLAMSPDGSLLAVGCWDPDAVNADKFPPVPAYLISLPDGRVRHELHGHKQFVHSVAFRPDGKCLATIGREGTIQVWNTGSGRPLQTISLHTRVVERGKIRLSWSPDGRRLASNEADGPVRIWDPETARETARIARKARSLAWSPDWTQIALNLPGDLGLEVCPWDAQADRLQEPVLRQPGRLNTLCWSPDSRRLAATWTLTEGGSPKCRLTVWDAASGEVVVYQVGNPAFLEAIAFSPDGRQVATCGTEEAVRVFDAADGRQHAALFSGNSYNSGLAFNRDGRRLFVSGWGIGGVKVFDPARDPRCRPMVSDMNQLAALAFDRDELRVLAIE